jgi:hypothetical protein
MGAQFGAMHGPERILQTRDGGYIFASGWGTDEFGINDWVYRPWIQKLDANGDTLWVGFRWIRNAHYELCNRYFEQNEGNLIACGQELIPNWDTPSSIVRHKKQGFDMKLDPAETRFGNIITITSEASNPRCIALIFIAYNLLLMVAM